MTTTTVQPLSGVLLDRDGTLTHHKVPHHGDPAWVEFVVGVRQAVENLRRAGVKLGISSNQSGIGCGLIITEQYRAAAAADSRSVLVPNAATRHEEIHRAPLVAQDLCTAVALLLNGSDAALHVLANPVQA